MKRGLGIDQKCGKFETILLKLRKLLQLFAENIPQKHIK